ncbi:MAG TPA: hypothetical protein VEC99_07070, partial [Clostridia bacterium]|nr:hypothetical protein [Clostridia bacterium]
MPLLVDEFECPKDPARKILLNLLDNDAYIMREPAPADLRASIESFEQEVLAAFWTKAILVESPYKKGLPYGLACNAAARNAVELLPLYEKLTGTKARHVHAASAFCRTQKYEDLIEALRQLQPKTVAEAESVLAVGGLAVLKTQSMLNLSEEIPDFKGLVRRLCEMTKHPGKGQRTAVNLLVRMRSEGWILLPKNIVQTIGPIVRGLHAGAVEWDKVPERYLSPKLLQLFEELDLTKEEIKCKQNELRMIQKKRYALLCSSIQGKEDLSFLLVRALLGGKGRSAVGANFSAGKSMRMRWSKIAMANGPGAMQLKAKNDHRRALEERAPQNRLEELKPWIDALVKECERFTGGMMDPLYKAFGTWMAWLGTLERMPQPVDITRGMIVSDLSTEANTFINFLEKRNYKHTKDKNLPLSKMHKFFERLRIEEEAKGR